MRYVFVIISIFALNFLQLNAQNKPSSFCGTSVADQRKMVEKSKLISPIKRDYSAPMYIPLQIHILGTDAGRNYFPLTSIYDALCTLNKDFTPSGIQFFLEKEINYIANTKWYDHPDYNDGEEMMEQNNVFDAANCYIVANPAGNCGYFSWRGDAIALAKGCTGPADHTFAHELGHYFHLPHTFYGWEGLNYSQARTTKSWQSEVWTEIENLPRDKCSNQADNYCGTMPDYLSYRWQCAPDGFSGVVMKDKNDSTFRADGSYYMSYSNDQCMNKFSMDQIEGMKRTIEGARQELIRSNVTPVFIGKKEILNSSPIEKSSVPHRKVMLSWEKVPTATQYIVSIARKPALTLNLQLFNTKENFVLIDTLMIGQEYFWKVRAVNNFDFCGISSKIFTFRTESLISDLAPEGNNEMKIYPNPVTSLSKEFFLQTDIDLDGSNVWLENSHGKRGSKIEVFNLSRGIYRFALPSTPSGIYYLRVKTNTSTISKKVILQ